MSLKSNVRVASLSFDNDSLLKSQVPVHVTQLQFANFSPHLCAPQCNSNFPTKAQMKNQ